MSQSIYSLVLLVLAVLAFSQLRTRRRSSLRSWEDLVRDLRPVATAGVHAIADAYLHPRKNQIELEPDAMFQMLGGVEGIETIRSNAKLILLLAHYAIQWNEVEATVVAEMIRRDMVRLRRAVTALEWSLIRRRVRASAPFQLQEIASSYHLMSSRLLALYETSHVARYQTLLAAI